MSDLNSNEKTVLEKFLEMDGGTVLDFSNRTFENFIRENSNINIYDEKYNILYSGSKANRLRAFWKIENNFKVGELIVALLEYDQTKLLIENTIMSPEDYRLYEECLKIANRLKQEKIVDEIEILNDNFGDANFKLLVKSIRDSVENNEPEAALDRLHTYTMKYFRHLCLNHNLDANKGESLNAVFGKYIKFILANGNIESVMTERILKYSIHIIEAFNDIRNNRSFAHDNPVLNYHESILILNNITISLKFIDNIENILKKEKEESDNNIDWNDLPF